MSSYSSIAPGRLTSDWPRTTHHFETDSFQNDKYDPITNKDQLAVQPRLKYIFISIKLASLSNKLDLHIMYYPLLRKGDVMKSFPLIVVLFILLIIVGTSFFGGY